MGDSCVALFRRERAAQLDWRSGTKGLKLARVRPYPQALQSMGFDAGPRRHCGESVTQGEEGTWGGESRVKVKAREAVQGRVA
jgi:hypothetical protein